MYVVIGSYNNVHGLKHHYITLVLDAGVNKPEILQLENLKLV